jgi:hypothetical protein
VLQLKQRCTYSELRWHIVWSVNMTTIQQPICEGDCHLTSKGTVTRRSRSGAVGRPGRFDLKTFWPATAAGALNLGQNAVDLGGHGLRFLCVQDPGFHFTEIAATGWDDFDVALGLFSMVSLGLGCGR